MRRHAIGMTAALLASLAALPALGKETDAGFQTARPAMLRAEIPQGSVEPLISVGDVLPEGYRFEAIPDGIAVDPRGSNALTIYVNHETSLVPFPANVSDFDNAQLSELVLKRGNGKLLAGSIVIPSSANFQRFCSNFFAGAEQGFTRELVLTNEEASDFVNRTGLAWPSNPGDPSREQAGLVVAFDPDDPTGPDFRPIYGLGRYNHENSVALPGYGQAVILSSDDTFAAPSSQLYMYLAANSEAVWNDQGHLWAFQADAPDNDYGDITTGESVTGQFISVPDAVADGDQTGLETWSNTNNVFQFIRVEDIAYDRTSPNVVYFADTGEPRAIAGGAGDRLQRGPSGTQGPYPNGRVFKMVLDPQDPINVLSLSILIDGDSLGAAGAKNPALIHNPDNVETTATSLLIQEDPGSQNQYLPTELGATSARIWRYDLESGELTVVASVDQSLDASARLGAWESSGIVDVSQYFGRGAFLVTIQAHTLNVETQTVGSTLFKREDGQLLLLRIPGA